MVCGRNSLKNPGFVFILFSRLPCLTRGNTIVADCVSGVKEKFLVSRQMVIYYNNMKIYSRFLSPHT